MKQVARLVVMVSVSILLGCATAKRVTVLEMPDLAVTSQPPVDITPYLALAGVYDGVFLDFDQVTEHAATTSTPNEFVKDFWLYSKIFKQRYIILNPEAEWLTTFEIGFKPDKIYLRSTSPRGEVHTYGLLDLKEVQSSKDDFDYKFAFPHVEKGTVIEIGYEWTYSVKYFVPPLEESVPLQYIIPCEHIRYRFSCPDFWTVQRKAEVPGVHIALTTTVDTVNHMQFLTYEANNVPAYKRERFAPPIEEVSPRLHFRVCNILVGGQRFGEQNSWEDVVGQLFKYQLGSVDISQNFTQQRRHTSELPAAIRLLADSLARTATTRFDTIQAVNRYVSTNIKMGGSSHGGNVAETFNAKKGGIFDICSVTMKLLELLQIRSQFVLLHDRDDGPFDRGYVSLEQMSSPALRVTVDSTNFLLFPWVKNLPIGYVPPSFQGQPAILLGNQSIDRMWDVPYDTEENSRINQETMATVDSTGVVRVRTDVTFQGGNAYGIRYSMEKLPGQEGRDSLKSWTLPHSANLKFDSIQLVNDTDYYRPFIVKLFYQIPNAVTVTPDEIVVQIGELFAPIWEYRIADDSATRTQDIDIDFERSYRRALTLSVPHGWMLTSSIPDIKFESQFGRKERFSHFASDTLFIDQTTKLLRSRGPKEKVGELQELVGSRASGEMNALVFSAPHP